MKLVMDEKAALSAYSNGTFSGNYMAEIKEAIVIKGTKGSESEGIQLRCKLEGRPDDKTYPFETIYYCDSHGKPTDDNGKVLSLLYLTKSTNRTAKVKSLKWDFDAGANVEYEPEQFVELIGKKVGITVLLSRPFKKVAVNGYTGKPYPKEDMNKYDPEKVYIENYNVLDENGDIRMDMKLRIKYFFNEFPGEDNVMHKMTYQEMKTGASGKNNRYLVEYQEEKGFSDYTHEAKTPTALEEMRRKELKKNLKKDGIPFDSARFRSIDDIDEDVDDVDAGIFGGDDEEMLDDLN